MELPKYLFHYTSVEGVNGILESKSVWASLLHFMNDSREWLYALDLMRTDLKGRLTANPGPLWPLFITRLSESLDEIEELNVYVFSLSAVSNQLSQWRAYCPPEGGYELRFNTDLLIDHVHRHGFQFRKCCYDRDKQRHLVRQIADKVVERTGSLRNEDEATAAAVGARTHLFHHLAMTAPLLKHSDFSEENEWRAFKVVVPPDQHLSYHIKGSIVVPHYTIDLETPSCKFAVDHITVGPNVHRALALRGIRFIASRANVSVGTSSTPLRGF